MEWMEPGVKVDYKWCKATLITLIWHLFYTYCLICSSRWELILLNSPQDLFTTYDPKTISVKLVSNECISTLHLL